MARNTINYTVTDAGRDNGKVFQITEMSARRAESWAYRALLALISGGVEVPQGFEKMSMAAMAEVGIKALQTLKWEVAEPLLDEMMTCVRIIPDPQRPQVVRDTIEEDFEEIPTLIKLRAEVWKLHVGFFKTAAPLMFAAAE